MISVLFSFFLGVLPLIPKQEAKERIIIYNDTKYQTTFDVSAEFYGEYKGRKTGHLILRKDGTGEYKYDIFGLAPTSCKRGPIQFIWGFIVNEKGDIVRNERAYGFSYPVLLKSSGENSFQGCRTEVMMDFILRKGEKLQVSSSDDWEKTM